MINVIIPVVYVIGYILCYPLILMWGVTDKDLTEFKLDKVDGEDLFFTAFLSLFWPIIIAGALVISIAKTIKPVFFLFIKKMSELYLYVYKEVTNPRSNV